MRSRILILTLVSVVGCSKDVEVKPGDPVKTRNPIDCGAPPAAPGTDGRGMAYVPLGNGACFWIDTEEVTVGAYAAFLPQATNADGAACSANTDFDPMTCWQANGVTAPTDQSLPVTCVDFCDARAYCAWAGKRLCRGATGKTANASDPDSSEWFVACADQAKLRPYPYAGTYEKRNCNGSDAGNTGLVAAGSLDSCRSPEGVSDLSGNAAEWSDECDGDRAEDSCLARGGSYLSNGAQLQCSTPITRTRASSAVTVGFRCCAD